VAALTDPLWRPETQYARNGDVSIAYQAFGEGPTFVGLPGIINNVEVIWDDVNSRHWLSTLATFCQVVIYDKRGQGLSERDTGVPTLDERMADLTAVLDAVGAGRVSLGGISEGGTTAAMYAATFPERVDRLILWGSFAHPDVETGDRFMPMWAEKWGTSESFTADILAPSVARDQAFRRWMNRFERATCTPAGLMASWRWIRETDVRPALPSIQCPTLVLHRTGDRLVRLEKGREFADAIPGARFLELEGSDHLPQSGDTDRALELFEEFVVGHRAPAARAQRVLASVLFTDIVNSTERAVDVGDSAWKQLLDRHDEICRSTIASFDGRWIKAMGDGVLATFDAPGRALSCADALRTSLADADLPIRSGIHTGEIELRGDDVGGVGVNIAARVSAQAGPGEVLVSRTVKDLVAGSGYAFTSRGAHRLKGLPEEWELFAVEG
jgi:class 3 adenylate cyclase